MYKRLKDFNQRSRSGEQKSLKLKWALIGNSRLEEPKSPEGAKEFRQGRQPLFKQVISPYIKKCFT